MVEIIFGLFGGLAIFIFGIKSISDGLQTLAGKKTHKVMGALTSVPIVGVLVGGAVTMITQSSTLITVMTVGFVNTGMLTLRQAISVIMGANIGTTLTAQLVAFRITDLWVYLAFVGFALYFFSKNKSIKNAGFVTFSLGLLLLGMLLMSQAMAPLRHEPAFEQLMATFSTNRVLGVLAGAVFTALVQSSTAATSVIIAMAMQDIVPFSAALPLILGTNVGTTITAVFASIGGSVAAKRAAAAHVLFNFISALIFLVFLSQYEALVMLISPAYDIPRQIANAHTVFSVIGVAFFLPFIKPFAKLLTIIIPGQERGKTSGAVFLDWRMVETTGVALNLARNELLRMAEIAGDNIKLSVEALLERDMKKVEQVMKQEEVIDELEKEIMRYLARISESGTGSGLSVLHAGLLHAANDIERVSDHADNIATLTRQMIDDEIQFSDEAVEEIQDMYALVLEIYDTTIQSFRENNTALIPKVEEIEALIDEKEEELRVSHTARLREGRCTPDSGMFFLDIIANFERIGDHSNNISHVPQGKL